MNKYILNKNRPMRDFLGVFLGRSANWLLNRCKYPDTCNMHVIQLMVGFAPELHE